MIALPKALTLIQPIRISPNQAGCFQEGKGVPSDFPHDGVKAATFNE
jgi:hypothetical protein